MDSLSSKGRRGSGVSSSTAGGVKTTAHGGARMGAVGGGVCVGGGDVLPVMHKLFSIEVRRTQIQVHAVPEY